MSSDRDRMLLRFCLYGLLKNQRYFEPFLLLVYLDRGFSFTAIGSLVAAQQLTINLLEVPSGVLADAWGRRRTLIVAFAAYIAALLLWGTSRRVAPTVAAALLVAAGDAFRSGTHKALIFAWLRRQGRESERTRIYGLTRSWSKIGSAVSIVLGAALVVGTGRFEVAFLATVPVYLLAMANLRAYPAEIDLQRDPDASPASARVRVRALLADVWHTLRTERSLRRVILESACFDGIFAAMKDYLQPALLGLAAGAGVLLATEEGITASEAARATAPAYLVLALAAGVASRQAHRFVGRCGGNERRAMHGVWIVAAGIFVTLAAAGAAGALIGVVVAFVALHVLQNLWRPIVVSRLDATGPIGHAATTLSADSQAGRLATMVLAPLVGASVDALRAAGRTDVFWPLGVLGTVIALAFVVLGIVERRGPRTMSARGPSG